MKARDNPFSSDRILGIRYRMQQIRWDEFMCRLKNLGFRAALVGPEGSGKTTLLEDLEPALRGLGFQTRWLRLDRASPTFSSASLSRFHGELEPRDIILFDGAEQLSPFAWRRFKARCSQASGLIITTHRPGRLPTALECSTSPGLLGEIAGELAGDDAEEIRALAPELYGHHQGNLRNALRSLYDLYATR